MDAVRAAVTNGVSRFTQAGLVGANEMPIAVGGAYRFPARSREEILASQKEAASAGEVNPRSPFAKLQDPALTLEVEERFSSTGQRTVEPPHKATGSSSAVVRDPGGQVEEGWLL